MRKGQPSKIVQETRHPSDWGWRHPIPSKDIRSHPTTQPTSTSTSTSLLDEKPLPPIPKSKRGRVASVLRWILFDQWFLLALGVLILTASRIQVPQGGQEMKKNIVTYLCVSIIFFVTGCTLPTRTLLENYSRWKIHFLVQTQSFFMTSFITFVIVTATASNPNFMSENLLIGMLFMGSVPTSISSNVVLTKQAHGNVAFTVVQSTIGNFIAPFLTPALMALYTFNNNWYTKEIKQKNGDFQQLYSRVFQQLGLSVFLPMVIGQAVQNLFPNITKKVFTEWKLSKLGSVSLLVILWQTFDQAFASKAFTSVPSSNMVFICCIAPALFGLWLAVAFFTFRPWLTRPDTVSACFLVPTKTPSLGVPLATAMYVGLTAEQQSQIQIPLVIFQGLQIFFGSLLTLAFRRWVDREKVKDPEDIAPKEEEDAKDIAHETLKDTEDVQERVKYPEGVTRKMVKYSRGSLCADKCKRHSRRIETVKREHR